MSSQAKFENLFSYGTLQDEAVQVATFERKLQGEPDVLPGYQQTSFDIYLNIQFTGNESDQVAGIRFTVTRMELEQADIYEGTADYKRVKVRLKSGAEAWVYLGNGSDANGE